MVPLSILDLAAVVEGGDVAGALNASADLARHAEAWGYRRFWLAEHHNMPGIASAATSVCLAHVAAATSTIRVGAGGVMLPNHAPLVIAEQFGTLAALHPGRIDLGLGRAPGTDPRTAHALRRTLVGGVERFPDDVEELLAFLAPPRPGQPVQAVPGGGAEVEVWILGSSTFGARLAAQLGLPYAFASHFAPRELDVAVRIYRETFRPSARCPRPQLMIAANVIAAESEAEARRLRTSQELAFLSLRRGRPGKLPPPVEQVEMTPDERFMLDEVLSVSCIGTAAQVRAGLEALVARTGADELICVAHVFDHAARLRSYQLAAGA